MRRDAHGHSELFDLHSIIGLPDNAVVQSFHVEQSWSLKLYLAVAYQMDDVSSSLLVLKPFSPEQLHSGAGVLPTVSGDRRIGTVQEIYMVRSSNVIPELL